MIVEGKEQLLEKWDEGILQPALTYGGLPVGACDVVPFEAIIVDVVQHGQTVLISFTVVGLGPS